jgi:hypothetical protein
MTKKIDAHQAEIKSEQAEMRATIKAWSSDLKNDRKETTAYQKTVEARLEVREPASADTAPEVAYEQEVPVEDAEVRSVAEPRKRGRDGRNLAAVRRQKRQNRDLDARRRGKQTGLGRCPQRDDPPCGGCATQDGINKGDSGILRIPEESDRRL